MTALYFFEVKKVEVKGVGGEESGLNSRPDSAWHGQADSLRFCQPDPEKEPESLHLAAMPLGRLRRGEHERIAPL